jgi:hypothetical protein
MGGGKKGTDKKYLLFMNFRWPFVGWGDRR